MAAVLEKNAQIMIDATKKMVSKNLEGHFFELDRMTIDKKEWKSFQDKVEKEALTLIREIYRLQRNYKRVYIEDLTMDFRNEENLYYFDFFSDHGSVCFAFNKGLNGIIRFQSVAEEIYEEEEIFSLF